MSAIAERKPRRRWKAWALIEPDGQIFSIDRIDPETVPSTQGLLEMGWECIPVEVIES